MDDEFCILANIISIREATFKKSLRIILTQHNEFIILFLLEKPPSRKARRITIPWIDLLSSTCFSTFTENSFSLRFLLFSIFFFFLS